MDLSDIFNGVVGSILGGIALLAIAWLISKFAEFRNQGSGNWDAAVFDNEGRIVKRDIILLRQKGEVVHGRLRRVEPKNERHRRWHCYGRVLGRIFFGIFWPIDKSVYSQGAYYLRRYGPGENCWAGYYYRHKDDNNPPAEHESLEIISVNVVMVRSDISLLTFWIYYITGYISNRKAESVASAVPTGLKQPK